MTPDLAPFKRALSSPQDLATRIETIARREELDRHEIARAVGYAYDGLAAGERVYSWPEVAAATAQAIRTLPDWAEERSFDEFVREMTGEETSAQRLEARARRAAELFLSLRGARLLARDYLWPDVVDELVVPVHARLIERLRGGGWSDTTSDRWLKELEVWAARERDVTLGELEMRSELWTYALVSLLDLRGFSGVADQHFPPGQDRGEVLDAMQRAIDWDFDTGRIGRGHAERLQHHLNLLRNRVDPPDPKVDLPRMAPRSSPPDPADRTTAMSTSSPGDPWITPDVDRFVNTHAVDLGAAWLRQFAVDCLLTGFREEQPSTKDAHINEVGELYVVPSRTRMVHAEVARYGDISLEVYSPRPKQNPLAARLLAAPVNESTLGEQDIYWGVVVKTAYDNYIRVPLFCLHPGIQRANTVALVGEGMALDSHNDPELVSGLRERFERYGRAKTGASNYRGGFSDLDRELLVDIVDLVEKEANPDNDYAVNLLRSLQQYKHGDIRGRDRSTRDVLEDEMIALRDETREQKGQFVDATTPWGERELYVLRQIGFQSALDGRDEDFTITAVFDGSEVGEISGLRTDVWTFYLAMAVDRYAAGQEEWQQVPRYRVKLDEWNRLDVSVFELAQLGGGRQEWVEDPATDGELDALVERLAPSDSRRSRRR